MAPNDKIGFVEQFIIIFFFFLQLLRYPLLNLDTQPPAPPPKPKRRHRMWVKTWSLQRDDKGAYTTMSADLYNIDMPGFRNNTYIRMTPEFFKSSGRGWHQGSPRERPTGRSP